MSRFGVITRNGIVRSFIEGSQANLYDPDAQAFFTAASITDNTQKSAVNTLVLSLKSANIWSKMKALYPVVGGVASAHAVNLKQPGTYNLTFATGWTHASTGMTPSNSYANTALNQNPILNQNSWSMSVYLRTNIQLNAIFGASETGVQTALYPYQPSNTWAFDDFNSTGTLISDSTTNSLGFYQGVRQTSSVVKMIKNTAIASKTSNSSGRNAIPFFYGAVNFNGTAVGFSSRQIAFGSIGDGLTDVEATNFYTAVQTFQTTLNRQVP